MVPDAAFCLYGPLHGYTVEFVVAAPHCLQFRYLPVVYLLTVECTVQIEDRDEMRCDKEIYDVYSGQTDFQSYECRFYTVFDSL